MHVPIGTPIGWDGKSGWDGGDLQEGLQSPSPKRQDPQSRHFVLLDKDGPFSGQRLSLPVLPAC